MSVKSIFYIFPLLFSNNLWVYVQRTAYSVQCTLQYTDYSYTDWRRHIHLDQLTVLDDVITVMIHILYVHPACKWQLYMYQTDTWYHSYTEKFKMKKVDFSNVTFLLPSLLPCPTWSCPKTNMPLSSTNEAELKLMESCRSTFMTWFKPVWRIWSHFLRIRI